METDLHERAIAGMPGKPTTVTPIVLFAGWSRSSTSPGRPGSR
ncbi:MAG: hypothetical protein R2705_03845 [Ilumatobacteraceae bacterium]